jgi:hypothetical protein
VLGGLLDNVGASLGNLDGWEVGDELEKGDNVDGGAGRLQLRGSQPWSQMEGNSELTVTHASVSGIPTTSLSQIMRARQLWEPELSLAIRLSVAE